MVEHANQASDCHRRAGDARAAARAQTIAGEALFYWGRSTEAREQLTAALDVLRVDPDADAVRALARLAWCEVFAGLPAADRLTTEALTLGQALGVGLGLLADVFLCRGVCLYYAGRVSEAVGYLREAARLAEQVGDIVVLANVLVNLSEMLTFTDPAAAADSGRAAAVHARQVGDRDILAYAVGNLAEALLMLGDWDAAEDELTRAAETDGLADYQHLARDRAWLAALRGDAETADAVLAGLPDLRDSEHLEDKAFNSRLRCQPLLDRADELMPVRPAAEA